MEAKSLKCGQLAAAILVGGLGTRLSSVLAGSPKVLAPVRGRPFLAYLFDQLEAAGFQRVVLCTGYLGEQVQLAFGDRYRGLNLTYSQEKEPLGTGGALRLAFSTLDSDPFLVMNGDSYCDADLDQFVEWHQTHPGENTLLVTYVPDTRRFGRVRLDPAGQILSFEEKHADPPEGNHPGVMDETLGGWINAGIYLLSRRFLSSIPSNRPVSLERDIFPAWVGRGLRAYQVRIPFLDIGIPESYAAASSFLTDHFRFSRPDDPTPHNSCHLVLLDRDGTINVEKEYLSNPDDVELLDNAAEGIRRLRNLGLKVVVITNQSGVGRGYFEQSTLQRIHKRLLGLLAAEGAQLDGIYVCPHHPDDGCGCRKPQVGLLRQAAEEFKADLAQAFVIGDNLGDIEAGRRVGATTLLVRTGYGADIATRGGVDANYVVADLAEAAEVIAQLVGNQREAIPSPNRS
ncbi:MAG: D-glycero-beta-D-manno-heptose 1,7-bisphosphate 7-phosphatase [Acidobacteria bacterium]|nr:D-glycero-beta-D-manno-heptose 1,7-bisphosphate 7-phosphatase [Acidobacteriota bacterium]